MKIGLVAGVGVTIDAFFIEIVAAWRGQGHQVEIAVGPDGPPTTVRGVTVLAGLSRRPTLRNVSAIRQLRGWVDVKGIDILVTNTATSSLLVRAAGLSAPVAYFCHGLHWQHPDQRSALPWVAAERWALRRTQGVICLNSDDEQWFRAHSRIPLTRLEYGVGLDLNKYPRVPVPSYEVTLRLVWIGELSPRKRPQDAVETVANLLAAGVDVELDMLGEGALNRAVARDISRRALEGRVRLHGRQPVRSYLAHAHALLHTAMWEGLPRVGLESAAIGRTVLAYDTKGTRDLPGVVLSESDNPAALAKTVANWVKDGLPCSGISPELLSVERASVLIVEFLTRVMAREAV